MKLKRTILLCPFIYALVGATVALAAETEERQTIRKSFTLAGDRERRLELDNFEGTVKVTGTTSAEVEFVIDETVEADSAERAAAARRETHLDLTQTNNAIRCYADGPFRCRNGSNNFHGWKTLGYKVRYDIAVKLPAGTDYQVKTVNGGDLEIENTSGSFNLDNVNGAVHMTGITGAGHVYALNGGVRVKFTANPTAPCYFGSLNGNVEVWFRPGLSADARLKTFNGHAYADFPVSSLPSDPPTKKVVNGRQIYRSGEFQGARIGQGGPELKFDSFNGDIRILEQKN